MIDEALDTTTHDTVFEGYDEAIVEDLAQCIQFVKITVLLILGELFDDISQGIDYFGVFGNKGNISVLDAMIKSAIKHSHEVTDILFYSSTVDKANRSVSISWKIATIYGESETITQGLPQ
jgi:uncharacterized linocin/CFP29 family protein